SARACTGSAWRHAEKKRAGWFPTRPTRGRSADAFALQERENDLPDQTESDAAGPRRENCRRLLEVRTRRRHDRLGRVRVRQVEAIEEDAELRRTEPDRLLDADVDDVDVVLTIGVQRRCEDDRRIRPAEYAVRDAAVAACRAAERAGAAGRSGHRHAAGEVLAQLVPIDAADQNAQRRGIRSVRLEAGRAEV